MLRGRVDRTNGKMCTEPFRLPHTSTGNVAFIVLKTPVQRLKQESVFSLFLQVKKLKPREGQRVVQDHNDKWACVP